MSDSSAHKINRHSYLRARYNDGHPGHPDGEMSIELVGYLRSSWMLFEGPEVPKKDLDADLTLMTM